MKRIIISILLAVSFSALSAQNVIDTIIDTARYYYYYQWQGYDNDPVCDTCLTSFELPNTVITQEGYPFEQAGRSLCPYQSPIYDFGQNTQCNGQPGTAEYATRFYTSRPLQVVGLAVGMILKLCREEDAGVEARLDLRIWTPQGDSLLALDSVTVTHSNLARRHRVLNTMCPDAPGSYYYAAQPFYSLDDDVYMGEGFRYVYMYEGYFDKPISITDTFYIGMKGRTDLSNFGQPVIVTQQGQEIIANNLNWGLASVGKFGYAMVGIENPRSCHYDIHRIWRECGTGPWLDQKDRWIGYSTFLFQVDNYATSMGASQFLFPIIIPEPFHCPEVQNIRVTSQTATTTIVEWSAHDHHAYYEYVYGVEGSDPDTLPVLYVTDTLTGLFHLDSNVRYQCWVRAVCEVDSTYRSAWSNPITVWMGIFDTTQHNDDTTGILLASEYDTRVVLSPNPATTRLDIASEVTMQHVEIYNLHGKTFYEQSLPTTHLTVNLDGWPAGGYMVRIQTPDGTVMKKLIVRR